MNEFIFSRSARVEDDKEIEFLKNIQRYGEMPKAFEIGKSKPRYKFWDYSLAIELARRNKIYEIFDIGNGSDITYESLTNYHQIQLVQARIIDLKSYRVREHRHKMVTLFGELEHSSNPYKLVTRASSYLDTLGFLVITTDEDTPDKYKLQSIDSEYLLELSIKLEQRGFELYNEMKADYKKTNTPKSLVLWKVGWTWT